MKRISVSGLRHLFVLLDNDDDDGEEVEGI